MERPGKRQRPAGVADVLFVCHAGPRIGLGHLYRTLSVCATLRGRAACRVLVLGDAAVPDPAGAAFRIASLDADPVQEILADVTRHHPRAIVLDVFAAFSDGIVRALRAASAGTGVRLVGVDAIGRDPSLFDLIWIPSFVLPHALKSTRVPVRFGWDALLLPSRQEPQAEQADACRVIVLTGGGDVSGQGETLPAELDAKLPSGSIVEWVRGPFAQRPVLPVAPRLEWIVVDAPEGIGSMLFNASFALCVYGVSFFESLRLGVPSVVFSPYGDKDHVELEALRAEQACEVAANGSGAVDALVLLMADRARATRYRESGRRLLATDGATRLGDAILELMDA